MYSKGMAKQCTEMQGRSSAELGGVARSNGFVRLCYARRGNGSAVQRIASVGIGIALLRAAAQ